MGYMRFILFIFWRDGGLGGVGIYFLMVNRGINRVRFRD